MTEIVYYYQGGPPSKKGICDWINLKEYIDDVRVTPEIYQRVQGCIVNAHKFEETFDCLSIRSKHSMRVEIEEEWEYLTIQLEAIGACGWEDVYMGIQDWFDTVLSLTQDGKTSIWKY